MVKREWLLAGILIITAVIRGVIEYGRFPAVAAGQEIRLGIRVDREPEERWGKVVWETRVGKNRMGIELPGGTGVGYGDFVEMTGRIQERVIGGNKVGFKLIVRDLKILKPDKGPLHGLFVIRKKMEGLLMRWLPGNEGALAAGILLGGSEGMTEEGKLSFQKTGLLHIVAASGYNVGVVAGWIMAVGVWIAGRRWALLAGNAGIVAYICLAGAGTAIIRAGVMAILTQTAMLFGRKTDAGWVLLLSVLVMLNINPLWVEDVGFQLSVAATVGIIVYNRQNVLGVTMAAYMFTLPIILHYFGSMSAVAPVANMLVLSVVPIVMQVTGLAVGLGLIVPGLGGIVVLGAWPLLRWMTGVTEWMGSFGWSSLIVDRMGWGWVGIYYLIIILISNYQLLMTKIRR